MGNLMAHVPTVEIVSRASIPTFDIAELTCKIL